MGKSIYLCHNSTAPSTLLAETSRETGPISVLLLCQDFSELASWKEELPETYHFKKISDSLAETADRLRRPYLDLIAQLGSRYRSPAWWASRISEKNTMVSNLFLYCCYSSLIRDSIRENSGDKSVCIICESWAVLNSAADVAHDNDYQVRWHDKENEILRRISLFLNIIMRSGKLCAHLLLGRLLKRYSSQPTGRNPKVLIHTFVDDECLSEDGQFNDRYFPGLVAWLESREIDAYMLPVLVRGDRSLVSIWRWLSNSPQRFINPYSHYSVSDYVSAVRTAWYSSKVPKERIHLDNLDVTKLFEEERRRVAFNTLHQILYMELPKRLSSAGFRFDRCITEYEGMTLEKMLILGFRRYSPETVLIGFQHNALAPMNLCNFVTSEEAEFAPLPDRVICNGEFFRNILVGQGLPAELAVVGPALRYTHMHKYGIEGANQPRDGKKPAVLVLLSMMVSDARELSSKIALAFSDNESWKFYVKPHPMSWQAGVDALFENPCLPHDLEVVRGSMGDWLKKADLVISISSSSGFEAFAAGVPVINVGRERAMNLNNLGFTADAEKLFFDPLEIRAEAERLLTLSTHDLTRYRQRCAHARRDSFGEVTDKSMSLFVDPFSLDSIV